MPSPPEHWGLVALAIALGVWLRAWRLGEQVFLGDEYWTTEAAALLEPHQFLQIHNGPMAVSAPFAFWDWALIHSVGLEEWGLRLPMLAAGIALLPLVWSITRRHFGDLAALVAVGLTATSPILILYSRFARPYSVLAFLILLAVYAWERWAAERRAGWGGLSALAGGFAVFLHPFAGPAVAVLWLSGVTRDLVALYRGSRVPWLYSILWPVLGTLLVAGLSLPGWRMLFLGALAKTGAGALNPAAAWWSLHFLLGTRSAPVLVWLLASIVVGAVLAWRRQSWLTGVFAAMAVATALAVAALAPSGLDWSYVLGRYLVPALPGLLVFASVGIAAQLRWIAERLGFSAAAAAAGRALGFAATALVLGLAAVGSLPAFFLGGPNFTTDPDHHAPPFRRVDKQQIPKFYDFLAGLDGRHPVVEVPWQVEQRIAAYSVYQAHHRQPVRLVSHFPVFRLTQIRFRSVGPISQLDGDSVPGDYVILHRDLLDELGALLPDPHAGRRVIPPQYRDLFHETVRQAEAACRRNPTLHLVYQDDRITVFARRAAPTPHSSLSER